MSNEELVRENMKGRSEEDIQKVIKLADELESSLNLIKEKKHV